MNHHLTRQMYVFVSLIVMTALVFFVCGCSSDESVESLRKKGKEAFFNEDYAQARLYIGQALDKAPSDRELMSLMGHAHQRDYNLDSALLYFGRLDVLYPNDRETNKQIYELARALEDWQSAIDALKVLIATGDGLAAHAAEMSYLWQQAGSHYNTWYYAREALKRDSMNGNLYLQGATAAGKMDSISTALDMINKAIDLLGPDTVFLASKGTILALGGRNAEAEKIFRPFAEGDTTRLDFRLSLAQVLAGQDSQAKKREALKLYRSLAERMPQYRVGIDSAINALEEILE